MVSILNRAMTDKEFARLIEIMEEDTLECGHTLRTSEMYGCVALQEQHFLGCARILISRYASGYAPWCYLSDLYVEKPYRGQGLGATLLRNVEEQVTALGIGHIWTWTAGYEAPGFYMKQGYDVFCEQEAFFLTGHSRVGLQKQLPPVDRNAPIGRIGNRNTIHFVERDMTEAEFARMNAGFDEHTLEFGNPIEAPERHEFVAMKAEHFVGAISGLAYKSEQGYNRWFTLTDLYVEKAYRGQGTGTVLLRRLEDAVIALGITHMWLWDVSQEAQRFFQKQGYVLCCQLATDRTNEASLVGLRKRLNG